MHLHNKINEGTNTVILAFLIETILLGVIHSLNSFDYGTDSSISGFTSHLSTRTIIRGQS
jgi:hypothetical protein